MKKLFILLVACTILSLSATAQDEITEPSRFELGVNATYFISNFLGLNQDQLEIGPYAFTGKLRLNRTYLRFGLGGEASKRQLANDFSSNIFDRKTQALDLRTGIEWHRDLTERWIFYSGLDILLGMNLSQTIASSAFDEVVTNTNQFYYGLGPLLGFQFKINPKISLSTESSFYTKSVIGVEKNAFKNFPSQNFSESQTYLEFDAAIPTELFFIIHF